MQGVHKRDYGLVKTYVGGHEEGPRGSACAANAQAQAPDWVPLALQAEFQWPSAFGQTQAWVKAADFDLMAAPDTATLQMSADQLLKKLLAGADKLFGPDALALCDRVAGPE